MRDVSSRTLVSSQEFANYPGLEEVDAERVSNLMQEMSRKKKRPETWKLEEETVAREQREFTAVKADRATRATKPESPARSPARSPVRQAEIVAEEEAIAWPSARSTETATERSRVRKIRSKVCAVEVCKPEICCADMEGELTFRSRRECATRLANNGIRTEFQRCPGGPRFGFRTIRTFT